jgi:glycosyltransferase involved in cell wall biosynthesis
VLWSIRGAPAWDSSDPWHKRLTMWAGKKLSTLPQRIIHNSMVGAVAHEQLGYAARKRVVLPNGFDTELFQPSLEAKRTIRAELGVADGTVLVGLVGRFDPMKDHANFLRSAALLKDKYPHVEYVLVGGGTDASNGRLGSLIDAANLRSRRRSTCRSSLRRSKASPTWSEKR